MFSVCQSGLTSNPVDKKFETSTHTRDEVGLGQANKKSRSPNDIYNPVTIKLKGTHRFKKCSDLIQLPTISVNGKQPFHLILTSKHAKDGVRMAASHQ